MGEDLSLKDKLNKSFGKDFPRAVNENRRILICVSVIFLAIIVSMILLSQMGENPVNRIIREQIDPVQERIQREIQNVESPLEITAFLLRNNLTVLVYIIGFGVAFGLFPFYVLIINGLAIGYLPSITELTILEALSLLLPHGVFELTGYVLGIGCGVKLGIGSIKSLLNRDVSPLKRAGKSVSPIIPPTFILIVFAAFIEGIIGAYKAIILNSITLQIIMLGGSSASFIYLLIWLSGKLSGPGGQ